AFILFLAFFDWNNAKGFVAARVSAAIGHPVRIDGRVDAHLLSLTPSATITQMKIANPGWAGKSDLAEIKRLHLSVRLLPLFLGRLRLPSFELDQPSLFLWRQASGRANWEPEN